VRVSFADDVVMTRDDAAAESVELCVARKNCGQSLTAQEIRPAPIHYYSNYEAPNVPTSEGPPELAGGGSAATSVPDLELDNGTEAGAKSDGTRLNDANTVQSSHSVSLSSMKHNCAMKQNLPHMQLICDTNSK